MRALVAVHLEVPGPVMAMTWVVLSVVFACSFLLVVLACRHATRSRVPCRLTSFPVCGWTGIGGGAASTMLGAEQGAAPTSTLQSYLTKYELQFGMSRPTCDSLRDQGLGRRM
jgi:hypothetical protein